MVKQRAGSKGCATTTQGTGINVSLKVCAAKSPCETLLSCGTPWHEELPVKG